MYVFVVAIYWLETLNLFGICKEMKSSVKMAKISSCFTTGNSCNNWQFGGKHWKIQQNS